ncbi:hypothetical protein Q8F55_002110 [Vanrija albida]|uniref:WD40 repeat-like protein n=1 Tax=Vanrija albida TaxID=181172 RepID=A0ABR3Q8U9_9TREE
MPAAPPVAFATLAYQQPSRPYITGITPTSLSGHLILQHPDPVLTIADAQTLQPVEQLTGHTGPVTAVQCEEGSIWSSGKDATVVRWDERSRRAATTIKAFIRKPLPVTALAVSGADHLVVGGTELVSSEAHILFWDTRNASEPAYRHSSTHSDDITHLSILPPTASFQVSTGRQLPQRLLLSTATDGCVALSDLREADEDEAVHAEENWNQSIAAAGSYAFEGRLKVWARSDMDYVAAWGVGVDADDGELQLQDFQEVNSSQFKYRDFALPQGGPSVVGPAAKERAYPDKLRSEYLIDVCPSLGVNNRGLPAVGVGSNDGNIVLQHASAFSTRDNRPYHPSAYLLTGPGAARGHKDVVRAMFHAVRDEALYTGSEDGVLAGWSLASLPRLLTGNPAIDDDGGDGREDANSDDDEDEESEIDTESSESDRSDNSDDMEVDDGPRHGPVYGGGRGRDTRKDKRREKRHAPY